MEEPTPDSSQKDAEKNKMTEGAKVFSPAEGEAAPLLEQPQEAAAANSEASAPAVDLPLPEKRRFEFGRFLRGLVRALALVVLLLALGALAVELLRVRPLNQQYQALQVSATQTAADLLARQAQLEQSDQTLAAARGQAAEAQAQLEKEQARVSVLRITTSLIQSRLDVAGNNMPAAGKSLSAAEGYFKSILPQIAKLDSDQANTLQALFTLAKNDLGRDQNLYNQDADRLQSELELVEKNLLK